MNNPQAFPQCAYNLKGGYDIIGGMTLRDYFAAQAMQAYSSDSDWRQDMTPTDTAFAAYKQADAMLRAREEK
jgi:hypothetical protein